MATLRGGFLLCPKTKRLLKAGVGVSKPCAQGPVHQLAPILRPFRGCTGRAFILKGNLATWALEMSTGVFRM